jgi:hypothetical protein
MKLNVPIIGFVIGMLLPFGGLKLIQLTKFSTTPYFSLIRELLHQPTSAFPVFSLSLLANLLPFMYFTSKKQDLAARGIFIATMLYAAFILFLKYAM